jgi:phenylpropionate dioxygenase-like ring-hydroxylating dioxygenase large terminal subunit
MRPLQRGFEMELGTKLFQKYWHMVCHRNELPNDGDFLRFKTPIGDVVIFNDGGDYVAFDNRCAHRGALIYSTDFGNQANTCKYHGWAFKSGQLIIPAVEKFKGSSINKADFNRYKLDWCGDFLFVGITPQSDLYAQLDGLAQYVENISFNINGRLDASAYEYECSWPLALENALEPYHIGMVHPETLANLKLEDGVNIFYGANSVWQAPLGDERIKKQLSRLGSFFNIDYAYEGYISIFMFPFTMISSTFGYSYSLQNFFPHKTRHDRTNFMSRLLTCHVRDDHAQKIVQPFFDSSAKLNRMIFEEDHSICKIMPTDSWSPEPLLYMSEQEVKIAHFREMCRAALN